MKGTNIVYQIINHYMPGVSQLYRTGKQQIYRLGKRVGFHQNESWFLGKTPIDAARELERYDVVSFDVFDTLIFRPYLEPAGVFDSVAKRIGIPEFRMIRCEMEQKARWEKSKKENHTEVTLDEIYKLIKRETGITEEVKAIELFEEYRVCYANPYMKQVVEELRKNGKSVILISDMYLNQIEIRQILEKSGYGVFDGYYISCEYRKSKSSGELYQVVLEQQGKNRLLAHVGDNETADVKQAKRYGIHPYYYKKE